MRYVTSRLTYYVNVNVNQEFLAWLKQPKPTTYLRTYSKRLLHTPVSVEAAL